MQRLTLYVFLVLCIRPPLAGAQTTPVSPVSAKPKTPKSVTEATTAFLAKFRALPATATRIGNSGGGTTAETPVRGRTKSFADGAPMRLAIPVNADRVGLEYSPDKKEVLIRIHSYWNEGGWHDTYVTPEGKVVGGMFDVAFPRTDIENKTPENTWEFGRGFWIEGGFPGDSAEYRGGVPFKLLKPGPDSGVPGYNWKSDEGGLVITTPKARIYGLVSIETAVTDPSDPTLALTQYNWHRLDWKARGGGREQRSFGPTFNWGKYGTDPRKSPAAITHPGPLAAVRVGDKLYVISGENEVMVHRWDTGTNLLVPVAALYVRPDQLPASIPGHPILSWGKGAIARAKDGQFTADRWEVFDAGKPFALWNGYLYDVDPEGNLLFLPRWSELKDAGNGARWQTFDTVRGVFRVDNLREIVLPAALKTATKCEQIRIDWASGDLLAVVMRFGEWRLERYPKWHDSLHRESIKAAYSVGNVALSIRSQYRNTSAYDAYWGSSPDPRIGVPQAAFGTMAVRGDFVFVAEAQAGGVRIYRLSDGAIVGRMADRTHQNSTIDNPTQIQVTQTDSEYRVFLMDFHGKSALVWRITKAALAAALANKPLIANL